MIEEFKTFMKFNGWWDKYLQEFFGSSWHERTYTIDEFLDSVSFGLFLVNAFFWDRSDCGFSFWCNADYDWQEYLKYWGEEIGN